MLIFNAMLVAAIVIQRLIELVISKRHIRQLATDGVDPVPDPVFPWLVLCHVALLVGSAFEPWLLERPFVPIVGWTALAVLIVAQVLRIWVLRTLGRHWNVRIMASGSDGVVTTGPYQWVRHPNYAVVAIESVVLPLFHGAWFTLVIVQMVHIPVLVRRIRAEESYLMSLPDYRERMGAKPRFLPRLKS